MIRGIESLLKCPCGLRADWCRNHRNAEKPELSVTASGLTIQAQPDLLADSGKLLRLDREKIERRLGRRPGSLVNTAVKLTLAGAAATVLYIGLHALWVYVEKKKGPAGS
ncbi:hypothetical protein HYW67_00530 [Candidatus Parcubacteria bacterium]|nr:hypothetical protein [Candidatus Parcubacteria bacterium]